MLSSGQFSDSDTPEDDDDDDMVSRRGSGGPVSAMGRSRHGSEASYSRPGTSRHGSASRAEDESNGPSASKAEISQGVSRISLSRNRRKKKGTRTKTAFDEIREYAAAEKKHGVTAEQIACAIDRGIELRNKTIGLVRDILPGYVGTRTDTEAPNPNPLPKDAHLLKCVMLDNLYDVYVNQAMQMAQPRSVVALLQLHLRLFADWVASTAGDVGRIDKFDGPEFTAGALLQLDSMPRRRFADRHLQYLSKMPVVPSEDVNGLFLTRHLEYALCDLEVGSGLRS